MGGPAGGDGRLDLDDLDGALGGAAPLDVLEAHDDPRLGERIAATSGGRWVRRHRTGLAASTAGVVLLLGGVTALQRMQPPPLDPELRVTVLPAPLAYTNDLRDGGGGSSGYDITPVMSGALRVAYRLRARDTSDGSRYEIVGLTGPGVRASQVRPTRLSGKGLDSLPGGDVDVVVDCTDPATYQTADQVHELVVARTDAWGRRTTGALSVGHLSDWPQALSTSCLGDVLDRDVEVLTGRVSRGTGAALDLRLTVRNPLPVEVTLSREDWARDTPTALSIAPVTLPASGVATVRATLRVTDCPGTRHEEGTEDLQGPGGEPFAALDPNASVDSVAAGITDSSFSATLLLPRSARVQLTSVLAALCAGSPPVRADLVTARPHPDPDDGSGLPTHLDVVVEVRTDGSSVQLLPFDDGNVRMTGGAATVQGGVARVRSRLAFSCGQLFSPPDLFLSVTTSAGTFPFAIPSGAQVLAPAVVRACGGEVDEAVLREEFGWPVG